MFAGLWLYLLGRRRQLAGVAGAWPRILAGILGGSALGALCKESAVLLPLYAACIELFVLDWRRAGGARDRRLLGFFGLVLVLPGVLGVAWLLPRYATAAAYAGRDFTLVERMLTETRVVLDYLRWTLFSSLREFALYHDNVAVSHGLLRPVSTAFSLAALALLAAIAIVARRRRPLAGLGIAWFLAAQLLTATIVPLELVFEHRNYFASLGICLALADLLLLAPRGDSARRVGALVAVLWLLFLGMTTGLRAREWSDPLRFAASEAAKHPRSPRATYDYARVLAIATGYKPGSPLLPQAFQALDRARDAPGSDVMPDGGLLILAARTGTPLQDAWWRDLDAKLRRAPVRVQEINTIASLTRCAREGACPFPTAAMLGMYAAALSHGPNAEVFNIQADYMFNVLREPDVALELWRRAIELRPDEPQYRINRTRVLIALGHEQEARDAIAGLRALGLDNEAAARELEKRFRGRQDGHRPR